MIRPFCVSLLILASVLGNLCGQEITFRKLRSSEKGKYIQVSFMENGLLVTVSDKFLEVWNSDFNRISKSDLKGQTIITTDGKINSILSADEFGVLSKLNIPDLSVNLTKSDTYGMVTALKNINDGYLIGNENGELIHVDNALNPKWRIKVDEGRINDIIQADDLAYIAIDKSIYTISILEQKALSHVEGHSDIIRGLDISSDNKYLVSAGNDRSIILWKLFNDQPLTKLQKIKDAHYDWIYDIKFNQSSDKVISSGFDREVKVFNFSKESEELTLIKSLDVESKIFKYLSQFDFDPNSYRMVVGTFGDGVHVSELFQTITSTTHGYSDLIINQKPIQGYFDTLKLESSNLDFRLKFEKPKMIKEVYVALNGSTIKADYDEITGVLVINSPLIIGLNSLNLVIQNINLELSQSEYKYKFYRDN